MRHSGKETVEGSPWDFCQVIGVYQARPDGDDVQDWDCFLLAWTGGILRSDPKNPNQDRRCGDRTGLVISAQKES